MRLLSGSCAALLVSVAIVAGLRASGPRVETVWSHTRRFVTGVQGADSWKPMEIARADAAANRGGLYERVFFERTVKFQYPPTALLLIGDLDRPRLNVLSWLATMTTALVSILLLRVAASRTAPAIWPASAASSAALAAIAAALAFTFYPAVKAYSLGQIQAWADALFAIALLAWTADGPPRGRRAIAGVMVAGMCLMKPTYALLLVWGVVRRRWAFVAAGGGVLALVLAASVFRYGLADHLDYLRVLSFIGRRGETFYPNQSVNGLVNRLMFNGSSIEWRYDAFPPFRPEVFAATIGGFVLLVGTALLLPRWSRHAGTTLDLSIMTIALTASAPVAWEHHYGILLPIYGACVPLVLARRALGRWTAPLLATSFVLAGQYFAFTNRFADTRLNVVQSYLFGAAMLLLALLCATARRTERA